jgi:hypothetical protein
VFRWAPNFTVAAGRGNETNGPVGEFVTTWTRGSRPGWLGEGDVFGLRGALVLGKRLGGGRSERMAGRWILEGTIAGKTTIQDVVASSVLNGHVQLHEVSREKDAHGRPEREALVYLRWEDARGEYSSSSILRGRSSTRHLAYERTVDTWQWRMDGEQKGRLTPFARVTLRHR